MTDNNFKDDKYFCHNDQSDSFMSDIVCYNKHQVHVITSFSLKRA